MKTTILYAASALLLLTSFKYGHEQAKGHLRNKATIKDTLVPQRGYSGVNGIKMYYEIYGHGKVLVLIHGGGSTIETTFGRVIPMLSKKYKVIAMDLQAHGRTNDRNAPESFERDADDVAALLKNLNIAKASFFGFSNGGTTAIELAIRHPEIVDKLILGSALCKRDGVPEQFWGFMKQATLANMPVQLKDAYLKVSPDQKGLQTMHDKDAERMINFKDIPDQEIASIKAPTFIIIGDKDVIKPEHAIEMQRKIAGSELAIIPGGHGEYIEEITTLKSGSKEAGFVIRMIENFLDKLGNK